MRPRQEILEDIATQARVCMPPEFVGKTDNLDKLQELLTELDATDQISASKFRARLKDARSMAAYDCGIPIEILETWITEMQQADGDG